MKIRKENMFTIKIERISIIYVSVMDPRMFTTFGKGSVWTLTTTHNYNLFMKELIHMLIREGVIRQVRELNPIEIGDF